MGSDGTYFFLPQRPYRITLTSLKHNAKALRCLAAITRSRSTNLVSTILRAKSMTPFTQAMEQVGLSYYGAIAMTYEQASARGLVVRQYDGVDLHYRETVRNHFLTSLATADTVADNREKFLNDFYEYRASAIDEGKREDIRAFMVPVQADQAAATKMAGLLGRQGIEVGKATEAFSACGRDYSEGSFVIRTDQPAKRFIRTLLDDDVPMEADFLAEQERRRARNLPDEIYDVTGWSLPLMMNVAIDSCSRAPSVATIDAGTDLVMVGGIEGGGRRLCRI